jgi:hypothetical protein
MAVVQFPRLDDPDLLIRAAIRERRLLAFDLKGFPRRAEPHDYGMIGGLTKLFFYQVGGRSSSSTPVGWRFAALDEMRNVRVLDDRFEGARETGSDRHVQWDVLIASVSRG